MLIYNADSLKTEADTHLRLSILEHTYNLVQFAVRALGGNRAMKIKAVIKFSVQQMEELSQTHD